MSTGQTKKISIQIPTPWTFPVRPPPSTAAEGERFFSIKALYFDMTSRVTSRVGSPDQAPHTLLQSEFFSRAPEIVRRIFSAIGVSLSDEELSRITPPAMAKFSHLLVRSGRDTETVLPIYVSILAKPERRPTPAPAGTGDLLRALRMSAAEAEQRVLTVPAKEESIEALEVVRDVSAGVQCSICLEDLDKVDISVETKIVRTPCSHVFHSDCIVRWLRISHFCPLCRYSMS